MEPIDQDQNQIELTLTNESFGGIVRQALADPKISNGYNNEFIIDDVTFAIQWAGQYGVTASYMELTAANGQGELRQIQVRFAPDRIATSISDNRQLTIQHGNNWFGHNVFHSYNPQSGGMEVDCRMHTLAENGEVHAVHFQHTGQPHMVMLGSDIVVFDAKRAHYEIPGYRVIQGLDLGEDQREEAYFTWENLRELHAIMGAPDNSLVEYLIDSRSVADVLPIRPANPFVDFGNMVEAIYLGLLERTIAISGGWDHENGLKVNYRLYINEGVPTIELAYAGQSGERLVKLSLQRDGDPLSITDYRKFTNIDPNEIASAESFLKFDKHNAPLWDIERTISIKVAQTANPVVVHINKAGQPYVINDKRKNIIFINTDLAAVNQVSFRNLLTRGYRIISEPRYNMLYESVAQTALDLSVPELTEIDHSLYDAFHRMHDLVHLQNNGNN